MSARIAVAVALLLVAGCDRTGPLPAAVDAWSADRAAGDSADRLTDLTRVDARAVPCLPGTAVPPLPDACTHAHCVQLLRLDFLTLAPKGFATLGGDVVPVDAAAAKQTAERYLHNKLKVGCQDCSYGVVLRKSGAGIHLFGTMSGDHGGSAMISDQTGQIVAAGFIVWAGEGAWWQPTAWKRASTISCGNTSRPGPATPTAYGWCHEDQVSPPFTFDDAVQVALRTNLALGLESSGPVDVFAYLYTPTVGNCDPTSAEFVIVFSYPRL